MKNTKKGFTLVELLVVIAILAILATVAVVGYTSFLKKADLSNDQAFIAQANTTLQAAAIPNGFKSAGEAINALNTNGFEGKYTPYSSEHYYGYHIDSNKLYLVNNKGEIIFPENSNVSADSLWYIWGNNAVDKVPGATKYVSLVSITGEGGYFSTHFADGTYTLDLAGKAMAYTGSPLTNVTVINGKLVAGATLGEGADKMEEVIVENIVSGTAEERTIVKDKVFFYTKELRNKVESTPNVTYQNCYFYSWSGEGASLMRNNVTFDGCTFIDATSYVFNIQGDSDTAYEGTFTVTNCEFINCARVFNIPLYVLGEDNPGEIIITNNTFHPVTGEKRSFMQIYSAQTSDNADATKVGYIDITISGNNFLGIATSQAGLITLRESLVQSDSSKLTADHITITNNTISSKVPTDKYVVNDDGKLDSAFANYTATEFKAALQAKVVAGKK